MKICIVSEIFFPQHPGGAELSSLEAARNLSSMHDVVVLSLGRNGSVQAPVGEQDTNEHFRVFRVPFKNIYLPSIEERPATKFPKAIWHIMNVIGAVDRKYLKDFLRMEAFDVVYAQNATRLQPALFEVCAELDLPVCQHLHDYAFLCPRTSMFRDGRNCSSQCFGCKILTFRMRSACEHVDTVISVSDFVKNKFLKNGIFREADHAVLHNRTLPASSVSDAKKGFATHPLDGPFTFGYLGAVKKEKGIEVLIEAFTLSLDSVNARLLIGGIGEESYVRDLKANLPKKVRENIEFMGHVDRDSVLLQSDAVIVPSIWEEPQGRVLIEAAVLGIPVIASKSGGISEVVHEDRIGWLYLPTDVSELKSLIVRAAQEGKTVWRSKAYERFPGLESYAGTAESSKYYERLNAILEETVEKKSAKLTSDSDA